MHFVSINLTFVTTSRVILTIVFHCRPIITRSQDFLGHVIPIGMHPEGTFMDLFYDLVCFVFIHTSEQNIVMVSLVHNTSVKKKLGCVLSESLLISDRSILWIFFCFKISFDIIKPWFLIHNFLYFITECWLIQPHDGDRGGFIRPFDFKLG